ncbi:hypothetical protein LK536_04895 [Lachnoclostridium pacaense]|uniref:hypothetical protein n=1 Tax=Enterocloster hominis (ex Hitch et al. 2024) TaxID=1917870 RepID=UPI001D12868E|nr:hypothetical protein [Lachnoclostridium pacaense]MCC2875606.1 hypothetical protein [Lachnoclostridium pacaense]
MSVASSSDAGYDVTALQEMLDDYEWQVMQSESLDTSVDNASIYQTAQNTSDIVQLLLCADFLLALILGCLLCSIFSRFLRG